MALGIASGASAAGPVAETEAVRSVPVAGMQVAIDPATGRLRQPTPAEARELLDGLRQMMKASPRAHVAQQHADGTLSLVLGAEALSVYVAKLGPDGSLAQACVGSPDEAARFLGAGAAMEEK
jgi:hypothetical protein